MKADEITIGSTYVANVMGRPTLVAVENLFRVEPWSWSCRDERGMHIVVALPDFLTKKGSPDEGSQTDHVT